MTGAAVSLAVVRFAVKGQSMIFNVSLVLQLLIQVCPPVVLLA